jgi:hypothetical protein
MGPSASPFRLRGPANSQIAFPGAATNGPIIPASSSERYGSPLQPRRGVGTPKTNAQRRLLSAGSWGFRDRVATREPLNIGCRDSIAPWLDALPHPAVAEAGPVDVRWRPRSAIHIGSRRPGEESHRLAVEALALLRRRSGLMPLRNRSLQRILLAEAKHRRLNQERRRVGQAFGDARRRLARRWLWPKIGAATVGLVSTTLLGLGGAILQNPAYQQWRDGFADERLEFGPNSREAPLDLKAPYTGRNMLHERACDG